jgi:peptide subunit release factor 1 (eRF1)
VNWQSHDLISEILVRESGDEIEKLMIAGLILFKRDFCWEDFLEIDSNLKDWALDSLAKWVKDGDEAPGFLRSRVKK